jgi:hypothetical protein
MSIKEQVIQALDSMTEDEQRRVLEYTFALREIGVPGEVLVAHIDDFQFAPGEVDLMMKAIEEECERID